MSSIGLAMGFSVLVGFGIGFGLDRLFHTTPVLTLVFLCLGGAAAVLNLVRSVRSTGGARCSSKD